MNRDLERLHPYPFEKLARLIDGVSPPADRPVLRLTMGEPQHPPPVLAKEALSAHLDGLGNYPPTRGGAPLRQAIAAWVGRRFAPARVDPETQVLPVNGTREALFAFAQAVVDRHADPAPLVAMPNPFYQIYEGAALLAGAEPYYLDSLPENGFLPDLDAVPEAVWKRVQLIYVCSPNNPTGAVLDLDWYKRLLDLAETHEFVIAADECYSEIYPPDGEAPLGLLQVAARLGLPDFPRCVVFHSLSKRSNLPGLRSGFVAGDAEVLAAFLRYRTYHGCAMPPPNQAASAAAWGDEAHVAENRTRYQEKFDAVLEILAPAMAVEHPPAGFYLWPETPVDDETFTRELYRQEGVLVLPGRYLSRPTPGGDPGAGRVRIALVPTLEDCMEAARRIRAFVERL